MDLIEEGYIDLTMDFSNVNNIDAFGLGKLLLIYKQLKENGGNLKIINITSNYVQKIFDIAQIDKILYIE